MAAPVVSSSYPSGLEFVSLFNAKQLDFRMLLLNLVFPVSGGRNNLAGTAARYELDSMGFETWWRARFSVPVHTASQAFSACCSVGTKPLCQE